MSQTAWKFAQSGANWTNSNNIAADDDAYATVALGAGAYSSPFIAKNFGFTTSDVPNGATIDGIEFRVRWKRLYGYAVGVHYASMRLSWGGSDGDSKAAQVTAISNSETSFVLGGVSDKWNVSVLSTADGDDEVRSAEFGLFFRIYNADAKYSLEVGIDSVECRVSYTFTPPAPVVTNDSASAVQGAGGTKQMSATNSPTSWSLTGSPPTGVSIDNAGLVTWTGATPVGVHSIGVRATNATGNGDGTLTLTITAAISSLNSQSLRNQYKRGMLWPTDGM